MVKFNRESSKMATMVTLPGSSSLPTVSDGETVQSGQEFPAKAPTNPKNWYFRQALPRVKIKRPATPHHKKSRGASKRPAPSPVPDFGRTRKKIVFELDPEILAGINGNGKEPPEKDVNLAGKQIRARPGPFEVCEVTPRKEPGHQLPLLEQDLHFAIGRSDGDLRKELEEQCLHDGRNQGNQVLPLLSVVDSGSTTVTENVYGSPTTGCNSLTVGEVDQSTQLKNSNSPISAPAGSHLEASANELNATCNGPQLLLESQQLAAPFRENIDIGDSISPNFSCKVDTTCGVNNPPLVHAQPLPQELQVDDSITQRDDSKLEETQSELHPTTTLSHGETGAEVTASKSFPPSCGSAFVPEIGPHPANADSSGSGNSGSEGTSENGKNKKPEPVSLDRGQTEVVGAAGLCEGIPTISFSNEETKHLADKLGYSIVGKFSLSLPSSHQIQKALVNIGLVGGFKWKSINAKHILIQFRDVTDYARVLNGPNGVPVWFIATHPMRVFKWEPDFDYYFESPIAAVWCNLIGIPIHLFEKSALIAIGKLLGTPIQADYATINQSRLSFARICVEIDISIPPPEEIIINILGKDTRYKVVWDRIPRYCESCKHVGHVKESCRASGKKTKLPKEENTPPAQPRRHAFAPNATRRAWRPKQSTTGSHTSISTQNVAAKEGTESGSQEKKRDVDTTTRSQVRTTPQLQVDEEGFQLVTRRRKGKSTYPLNNPLEGTHKASYLEKLLKGGNVATMSFGEVNVEVIDPDPGGGSTSLPC